MSSWSKFLFPVTVPTGGWTWAYSTASAKAVTVSSAAYPTVLHLFGNLSTAINDETASSRVRVNTATGKVTINIPGLTAPNFAGCSTDLLSTLGFDGTETRSSTALTANEVHGWAWYPGLLSLPDNGGVGLEDDTGNDPEETSVWTVSGSGKGRGVGPDRDLYMRTLLFGAVKTEEYFSRIRGPRMMKDRVKNLVVWWYFDRDKGDPGNYSTQVDPGSSNWEVDADGAYVKAYIRSVKWQRLASTPRLRNVTVQMNIEPK